MIDTAAVTCIPDSAVLPRSRCRNVSAVAAQTLTARCNAGINHGTDTVATVRAVPGLVNTMRALGLENTVGHLWMIPTTACSTPSAVPASNGPVLHVPYTVSLGMPVYHAALCKLVRTNLDAPFDCLSLQPTLGCLRLKEPCQLYTCTDHAATCALLLMLVPAAKAACLVPGQALVACTTQKQKL